MPRISPGSVAHQSRAGVSFDGPCVTCHVSPGRVRPTRLFAIICGPCWAAHGGQPDAAEIAAAPRYTAPLRYPDGQQAWLNALEQATWVQEIRIDGRTNLLRVAEVLAQCASWETLETWPGWDQLMDRTRLSRSALRRWLQELRVRGWLLSIERGSTPATRPMALALPSGQVLSPEDGNRRAVYALRIPLAADEAIRWAAGVLAAQAEEAAAEAAREAQRQRALQAQLARLDRLAELASLAETGVSMQLLSGDLAAELQACRAAGFATPGQGYLELLLESSDLLGQSPVDIKGSPTGLFLEEKKTLVGGFAREGFVVDNRGRNGSDPWGGQDQKSALRARSEEEGVAGLVPTSGFAMLVCAQWLRRRLPIFSQLTKFGVRKLCGPFWAAGMSSLDIVHAMDHLPGAFGARAATPIGRGPAIGLDHTQAWHWIKNRLDAWRDADGRILPGFYQQTAMRKALRAQVAERHGCAGAALLREGDATGLRPERIAEFGRRVARDLRLLLRQDSAAPYAGPEVSDPQVRETGRELLSRQLADNATRRESFAERHAARRAQLAKQLAAAKAALDVATGADAATAGMTPEQLAAWDALPVEERRARAYERAVSERGVRRRRRKA